MAALLMCSCFFALIDVFKDSFWAPSHISVFDESCDHIFCGDSTFWTILTTHSWTASIDPVLE